MSKLRHIRRALSSLRRRRAMVREASAATALLTGGMWILATVFVIDFLFEMDVIQRSVMLGVGAIIAIWVFLRYAFPLLGWPETTLDVALVVEEKAKIESDLVAALQFESADAKNWGSPELENLVVDRVAVMSTTPWSSLAVSHHQLARRSRLFLLTLAAVAVLMFYFPNHVSAFFDRMLLRSTHYPTRSMIDYVIVNALPVLDRHEDLTQPRSSRWAQGMPVTFLVQCSGDLPETGRLQVNSDDGGKRRALPLQLLSLDDRRDRLKDAAASIERALSEPSSLTDSWTRDVCERTVLDAPRATDWLQRPSRDRRHLARSLDAIHHRLKTWPGAAAETSVWEGRMDRLAESMKYQVFAGDAWTDVGLVHMTPLPLVELTLDVESPEYARAEAIESVTTRQLSVLEGSDISLSVRSVNGKQLRSVWTSMESGGKTVRLDLTKKDTGGIEWELDEQGAPFTNVFADVHYEVQVSDEDGLNLETPMRGVVRVRSDRPPQGSIDTIHRVVLGTAHPAIEYRVMDDYGIGSIRLRTQIERKADEDADAEPGMEVPEEMATVDIPIAGGRLLGDRLPMRATYALDLSSYSLAVGDRLKVAMELTDYRGSEAGMSYSSEPLVLQVSDEAGVLAAIAEADKDSEEQLSEVIKQQLGIGATP